MSTLVSNRDENDEYVAGSWVGIHRIKNTTWEWLNGRAVHQEKSKDDTKKIEDGRFVNESQWQNGKAPRDTYEYKYYNCAVHTEIRSGKQKSYFETLWTITVQWMNTPCTQKWKYVCQYEG